MKFLGGGTTQYHDDVSYNLIDMLKAISWQSLVILIGTSYLINMLM